MGILVTIAGNIGSGKSTIASIIKENMNFHIIPNPNSRLEFNFLDHFFLDKAKWFLPTQLSFIINKAKELEEHNRKNNNVVMDRSVQEDVEVFARMWYEKFNIDQAIYNLYKDISAEVLKNIRKQDLIIFCKLNPDICKKRTDERKSRSFELLYPENYLYLLDEYYNKWLEKLSDVPIITVDTNTHDLRDEKTKTQFLQDIKDYLLTEKDDSEQYSLFSDIGNKSHFTIISLRGGYIHKPDNISFKNQRRKVYIAAPFTDFAIQKENNPDLFDKSYGVLSEDYKKILLSLEKRIRDLGLDTYLPHRDLNDWGEKKPSPDYLMNKFKSLISECDYLFTIGSRSIGSHFEIGLAMGYGKKIVIFNIEEIEKSFFMFHFKRLPNVLELNYGTMNQLYTQLGKKEEKKKILNFLYGDLYA